MGFRSPIHTLGMPDYVDEDDPANSLVVKVVAPSAREAADLNAGRRTITAADGTTREENQQEFTRRAFAYLAPKIRFWNLEDEDGMPVELPLLVANVELDHDARLALMVDHLMEQDENIVYAIYHEWRLVSLVKKADTDEGKDSAPTSMSGRVESETNGTWPTDQDIRELEASIPM